MSFVLWVTGVSSLGMPIGHKKKKCGLSLMLGQNFFMVGTTDCRNRTNIYLEICYACRNSPSARGRKAKLVCSWCAKNSHAWLEVEMTSCTLSNPKDKRGDVESSMSQGGGRWDIRKRSESGWITADRMETDEKRDRRGRRQCVWGGEEWDGTGGRAEFHRIK